MCKKIRITINCFIFIGLASIAPSVFAMLVVNAAQSITHIVTVQPIIVSDIDGGNTAEFFGNGAQQTNIEGFIDDIWAQAGIDINFLAANSWNNTFANWGTGGPPNNGGATRPSGDLKTVVDSATAVGGLIHTNANVINIFFVNIAAGFDLLNDNSTAGLAFIGNNGITQYVGSNLLGFEGGQEVIAGVVAHEIGHNLGLGHPNPAIFENLMTTAADDGAERLNGTQITSALKSNFSVAVVPLPPAIWFFGASLLGLATISRRKTEHSH